MAATDPQKPRDTGAPTDPKDTGATGASKGGGTSGDRRGERVTREVGQKAERKIKARGREDRSVWFGLGMFGLVGWSVAVPTLVGVAIGWWLDGKLNDRISWTLTLMLVGVVLGCINAWYWVKRESRDRDD